MVNINISIPDDLHKQLRLTSVEQESTLKEVVIAILEEEVNA